MIYIEGYSILNSSKQIVLDNGLSFYKIPNIRAVEYYDIVEKVVKDAISNANLSGDEVKKSALFIGTSSTNISLNEAYIRDGEEILKDIYIDNIADTISQRVGIEGFKSIISTACSSSSNALIQAKEMIEHSLIDRAIILGVELYNELTIKGFYSFMLLSQTKMRPFDKNRDGIVLGEGISAIVIGKKRGDFRLAGGAIEVDNSSITAPTSNSLATVMSRAIEDADISTKDINLVKTHSTASIQNDKKEALALHKIFKEMPNILALKPYIGHTLGASGAVELTILIQFIRDGYIPKTINFKDMDESCNITPTPKEIEAKEGYYLLNYFGFGGNNSSLVLEYRRI